MNEKWESMEIAYYTGFDLADYRSKLWDIVFFATGVFAGAFGLYLWMCG